MFGAKKTLQPILKTDFFDLKYDQRNVQWTLGYKDIEFILPSAEVDIPKIERLDIYLDWINTYKEHIDSEIAKMTSGWDDVLIDASKAHIAIIEIEAPEKIYVMILGDETWGDLGYDLWFENGKIINEGFAG